MGKVHLPTVEHQNSIKPKKRFSRSKLQVELSRENWVNDPELTWLKPIFTPYYDQNAVQIDQVNIEDDNYIQEDDILMCL